MAKNEPEHPAGEPAGDSRFATTHWSVVRAAGKGKGQDAQKALAALCRLYWYPLYAFVRRQGFSVEDAEDMTQGFFARFLEKDYLKTVSPHKGKFRSYLLGALKHFLANERDRHGQRGQQCGAIDRRCGGRRMTHLVGHLALLNPAVRPLVMLRGRPGSWGR